MDERQEQFQERVHRLNTTHRALVGGYQMRMRSDGLVVAVPRRATVPVLAMGIVLALVFLALFKILLIADLGQEERIDRMSRLNFGPAVDGTGAILMQIEDAKGV